VERHSFSRLPAPPGLLGLAGVWVFFALANNRFLSAENLSALAGQVAPLILVAAGVVVVLLVGEIDLSVGEVAGVGATVAGVLAFRAGWPSPVAVMAGVAVGAGIGLLQGLVVARLGVPSFVVTLAGLLVWQGTTLALLGPRGNVNIPPDDWMARLAGARLGTGMVLVLLLAAAGLAVLEGARGRRHRAAAGLDPGPWGPTLLRLGAAVVVGGAGVAAAGGRRGVPVSLVVALVIAGGLHAVLTRTRFGRHLSAVGGDRRAAQRAGVPVTRVRISAFVLGSSLAAFGGVLAASRLLAVNQTTGSGDLLLTALAAAVIGGASLFGGRGTAGSAVLGVLVLGSLANGMDLIDLPSAARFTLNGTVLLAAATVDALSRSLPAWRAAR
jgi:D-xylose transport system permease protein